MPKAVYAATEHSQHFILKITDVRYDRDKQKLRAISIHSTFGVACCPDNSQTSNLHSRSYVGLHFEEKYPWLNHELECKNLSFHLFIYLSQAANVGLLLTCARKAAQ